MKRYVKSARTQSPKNWKMYAEYSDGYDTEVFGYNEEDCMEKLIKLCDEHGDLTYYTGVNDDDYIDGEYFSEEEREEAARRSRMVRLLMKRYVESLNVPHIDDDLSDLGNTL